MDVAKSKFNELSIDQAMYSEVDEIGEKHLKHNRKTSKLEALINTIS